MQYCPYNAYSLRNRFANFINPGVIASQYLNKPVDIQFANGMVVCNVVITYVSGQTDQTKPDYGDLSYNVYRNGVPYPFSTNTRNMAQITAHGGLCQYGSPSGSSGGYGTRPGSLFYSFFSGG